MWNEKAFGTTHDNILEGATTQRPEWAPLPVPDSYQLIPPSALDCSVQDLAHLYSAFARDRIQGTRNTPTFADAVALHRIIDAIECSSATGRTVEVRH